jgi:ATP-dependent RNA helicase DDX1
MAAFAEMGVMGELIRGLDEMGWLLPTPIQQEAIPLILGGGDVLGAAETGTGKTGAFGIPLLQLMHEELAAAAAPAGGAGKAKEAKPTIRMSTEDKEALFNVDAAGTMCSATSPAAWGGGRANVCIKQGKYFYEVVCAKVGGTVRVGFSSAAGSYELGTCPNGFGYGGTAKKSNSKQFVDYGSPYSEVCNSENSSQWWIYIVNILGL